MHIRRLTCTERADSDELFASAISVVRDPLYASVFTSHAGTVHVVRSSLFFTCACTISRSSVDHSSRRGQARVNISRPWNAVVVLREER